jgi:hypothetical protein
VYDLGWERLNQNGKDISLFFLENLAPKTALAVGGNFWSWGSKLG